MNDFAAHLQKIAELLNSGVDPVPLFEVKAPGAEAWSTPLELGDLTSPDFVYRDAPKRVTIGSSRYEVPKAYVDGKEYWAINLRSPNNPIKVTFIGGNSTLRYQAETCQLVETKKQAVDMAKSLGYWLSLGGDA